MFESRAPRSYDHLLTLSDAERKDAAGRLVNFLRSLSTETGKALYKTQNDKMRALSVKIGANHKGQNDIKVILPQGLIGIRRVIEPGKLTDEFQITIQPLEVTVLSVDYDYAEAILEDGSKLTFPPIFVAREERLAKAKAEIDVALREMSEKVGN